MVIVGIPHCSHLLIGLHSDRVVLLLDILMVPRVQFLKTLGVLAQLAADLPFLSSCRVVRCKP